MEGATTPTGARQQRLLLGVHEHLRSELEQIRTAIASLDGSVPRVADPADVRAVINRLSLRQHQWSLGAFCAAYCSGLTVHHAIEDTAWFPTLRDAEPDLAPVIDRLEDEHVQVSALLVELDAALVDVVGADDGASPAALTRLRDVADRLSSVLLEHLAGEERDLLPAIGRVTIEG